MPMSRMKKAEIALKETARRLTEWETMKPELTRLREENARLRAIMDDKANKILECTHIKRAHELAAATLREMT